MPIREPRARKLSEQWLWDVNPGTKAKCPFFRVYYEDRSGDTFYRDFQDESLEKYHRVVGDIFTAEGLTNEND